MRACCKSFIVLLVIWIGLAVSPAAAASPKINESEAVEIARRFLRQVGHPTRGRVSARLLSREQGYPAAPRWIIEFGDQYLATVNVGADTGVVISSTGLSDPGIRKPRGSALTKTEAIRRGAAALKATGQPGTMTLERAEPYGEGNKREWNLLWRRTYRGIPFRSESAFARIDVSTGLINSLILHVGATEPQTDNVSVSRDRALRIARLVMKKAGLPAGGEASVRKEVVSANGGWKLFASAGVSKPAADTARVAWTVKLQTPNSRYNWVEAWVDARTGTILGGGTEGPR